MTSFLDKTDAELLQAIQTHEGYARYYDAAESPQWMRETWQRNANETALALLKAEAQVRGLAQ
jgi:hypothetical protein